MRISSVKFGYSLVVNYFREPIDVIAPNLKAWLSGVTTTIQTLVPLQSQSIGIVAQSQAVSGCTSLGAVASVIDAKKVNSLACSP